MRGQVQGVNYRASLARRATLLELGGFVRNLPDGEVEACVEGPAAAVEEILAWCREGPPAAAVTGLDVTFEQVLGEIGFRIER